jgi:hypothetical protein
MLPSLTGLGGLAFAPGSTSVAGQLAYVINYRNSDQRYQLRLLDLATGTEQVFFDSLDAGLTNLQGSGYLQWSPGGTWLAWNNWLADSTGRSTIGAQLFIAPGTGGPARELKNPSGAGYSPRGFSADDRYLAVYGLFTFTPYPVALIDLNAADDTPVRTLTGRGFAWAPTGHTFAFSNDLGVFLVDAATGDYHWLQAEACDLDWAP